MEFKDIKRWHVEDSQARPINPFPTTHIAYMFFNEDSKGHIYATNAPNGIYSADVFGDIQYDYGMMDEINGFTKHKYDIPFLPFKQLTDPNAHAIKVINQYIEQLELHQQLYSKGWIKEKLKYQIENCRHIIKLIQL